MVKNYNNKMDILLNEENVLEAHIEDMEKRKFFLSMKDMWNNTDYEMDRAFADEIFMTQQELKKVQAAILSLVTANYCIA